MPVVSLLPAGITPAYAGNTYSLSLELCRLQDHPRLRGEHAILATKTNKIPGSPPPTRGTLFVCLRLHLAPRITPAYAGNTTHLYDYFLQLEDHPRLRGEHQATYI